MPAQAKAAGFSDVPDGADYAKAVDWAVENGVTAGVGKAEFGPDVVCTRGQIVTFLYQALGRRGCPPASTGTPPPWRGCRGCWR